MTSNIRTIFSATGRYVPGHKVSNADFLSNVFHDSTGSVIDKENTEIIEKFELITEIAERRYADGTQVTSDLATEAALDALESSGIDKESLDYIIVAHNFGDIRDDNRRSDLVPSLASRVKHKLGIQNPYCVAYDLPFGCPGWLQGVIQADYFIRSGDAKKALVIGAETLSRVCDPHDRDSMLYADGAGATILEAVVSDKPTGILAHLTRSDTSGHAWMLRMDKSFNGYRDGTDLFLKMDGRKLYEYALKTVPQTVKDCLDKAGIGINEVKKVLIHQANGKMDAAILDRLFALYGIRDIPAGVMPMSISWLGNSSVATLPTLFDLILKKDMPEQSINPGDVIVFASVGAGMNINAVVYRVPE